MEKIIISHLTKKFKEVTAVSDLSLEINKGEVFALLGMNGSGKTTTIKMLTGLIRPTSGDASLFGININDINNIKQMIGVAPQENAIANNLTVKENIELMYGFFDFDKNIIEKKTNAILEEMSLTKYKNRKAKVLSGGYKKRLSIAMALVIEPKVLFLDEPTLGLDVINRRDLWKIIKKISGKTTIFLTTHYMEEVEHLADHVAILKDGKLLAFGTLDEILKMTKTQKVEDAFVNIVGENKDA